MGTFDPILERWTPPASSIQERRRDRMIVSVVLLLIALAVAFSTSYALSGDWPLVPLNLMVAAAGAAALGLIRLRRRLVAANMTTAAAWLCFAPTLALNGGADAPFLLWLVVLPQMAGLLGTRRLGVAWGIVAGLTIAGFHLLEGIGIDLPVIIDLGSSLPMRVLQANGVILAVTLLMLMYLWNEDWAAAQMAESAERLREERASRAVAEQELLRSEARDAAKSEFLTAMSHELRTPLNAILGYSELLAEELEDRPDAVADLQRIHGAGSHLRHLIDDLLDLSRIEAGRLTLNMGDTSVDRVFDLLERSVAPVAATRGNALVVQRPRLTVQADEVRLLQILVNLVGNSSKFTEGGRIEVSAEASGPRVVLRVRDTGRGMDPDQLQRAFQPFEVLHEDQLQEGGTGLGLPLSCKLAEAMGGSLVASSTPGVGTTVEVVLQAA